MFITHKKLEFAFPLGAFSATLLVALVCQPSSAVTVNPLGPRCADNNSNESETYNLGEIWTVKFDSKCVQPINRMNERKVFKAYLDAIAHQTNCLQ
jgi:hypothetical protein